jgi:hypothetical protein
VRRKPPKVPGACVMDALVADERKERRGIGSEPTHEASGANQQTGAVAVGCASAGMAPSALHKSWPEGMKCNSRFTGI